MRLTQLRLAGASNWPGLVIDRFSPELNVLFGPAGAGKSTTAGLIAHLLYGKLEQQPAESPTRYSPIAEGSVYVDSPRGAFVLRRHRDGVAHGRLSIAGLDGKSADSRTIRALLADRSPRLVSQLYAVDFAASPSVQTLLDGEFARDFTHALAPHDPAPASAENGCATHAAPQFAGVPFVDRRRIDDLVRRRDEIARQIELHISGRRQENADLERELAELDAQLAGRRQEVDKLRAELQSVEAELADLAIRLRHIALANTVARAPQIDAEAHRLQLEQIDAEIARARTSLADLQAREAAVRRDLAAIQPDGTADGAAALIDQRATLSIIESLLSDFDAEVSLLARAHEPGRCVGLDAHGRLVPVANMLRQQLYLLCGQITEQERAARRTQLHAEARQLTRAQSELSELLEQLLAQRQASVHAVQIAGRPLALAPQSPAADHCRCERHSAFVRAPGATVKSNIYRSNDNPSADQRRRLELETRRESLRAQLEETQSEIHAFEARWQTIQRQRAGVDRPAPLAQLESELDRIESELRSCLANPWISTETPPYHSAPTSGPTWRASDVLAQLTGGELAQIRVSRDGGKPSIITRAGAVIEIPALNPAQHDQLYLALTLALVSSLAARGVDLPLVLDEPFIRQDAPAAAAMVGVLHEFSRQGRQLVLFTERRDAAERLASLGVEVRDIDLLRRGQPAPQVVESTIHPEPHASASLRIVRETVDGETYARPAIRLAQHAVGEDERDLFYLSADAPLDDFPVLGNDTARVFGSLGIRTVGDLLAADAADVADRLDRPSVTADAVRLWQTHMGLMCYVPGVSLVDAQILAANEVNSPDPLFTVDVRLLCDSVERFFASERGRRYAANRQRFTRERLAELQKLARQNQDHWRRNSAAYKWVDRPTNVEAECTPRGPRTAKAAPRRVAVSRPAKVAPRRSKKVDHAAVPRFLLDRASPVVAAPSIGARAATALARIGVRTVADLLNAHPESAAAELAEPRITPTLIAAWQQQARLMCRVPNLRSVATQLLVACGLTEPEQIARASAETLFKQVLAFCRTPAGRRILRNHPAPSRGRIAQWIDRAAHTRPLEAA